MTEDVPAAVPEQGAFSEVLSRRRLTFILAALLVEVALFTAGLFTPLPASTRESLANLTNGQLGSLQAGSAAGLALSIFAHNASIALAEMIPVAGALLFGSSVYSTGLAAQALVAAQGLPPQWGMVVFAFPYSLVELTAYAVAVVSGLAVLGAWRKKRLKREVRTFVLEGVTVVCILFVAAFMEAATLKISLVLGFALWLPAGLVVAAFVAFAGRVGR